MTIIFTQLKESDVLTGKRKSSGTPRDQQKRKKVSFGLQATTGDKYRVVVNDSATLGVHHVATCTGWRQICTHFCKRQLESFVNQLLKAAKVLSYRTGSGQCERFLGVSQILNSFLSAASMREMENVW